MKIETRKIHKIEIGQDEASQLSNALDACLNLAVCEVRRHEVKGGTDTLARHTVDQHGLIQLLIDRLRVANT